MPYLKPDQASEMAAMMSLKSRCIYSSFLRRFRRSVCVAASSLRRRGKEPDRPSMNRGAVK